MELETKQTQRILLFDVLKVLAMFGVIMIHVSAMYMPDQANTTLSFQIGNLMNSFTRCSVPIFFMVSGALLLNEDKSFTMHKMFRSIGKTLCLLYSWSFIYTVLLYVLLPILKHNPLDWPTIIHTFVFGYIHLWYLFALIGIYLVTPILKLIIKKDNMKYIEWYLLLSMIVIFIIPITNFLIYLFTHQKFLTEYANKFDVTIFNSYCAYFVLGWYLRNKSFSKKQTKLIFILGIAGILMTLFGAYFLTGVLNLGYQKFHSLKTINIFFYSVLVFMLIQKHIHIFEPMRNVIEWLSKRSFGVYVAHVLVLIVVAKVITISNPVVSLLVVFSVTAALSILVSFVMGKLPIIKKLTKF